MVQGTVIRYKRGMILLLWGAEQSLMGVASVLPGLGEDEGSVIVCGDVASGWDTENLYRDGCLVWEGTCWVH